MVDDVPKTRRRLTPEKRRELILDQAAKLVAREGVKQLTVERIGKAAGISKSLVYAYFPNLTELLRDLYGREMRAMRRLQAGAARRATTFEELTRFITHEYLVFIKERGLIIERLQSEPSVCDAHDPTEYGRSAAVDYLSQIAMEHFDLPADIARAATDISFGLAATAGSYFHRTSIDIQTLEDITVNMFIGSFNQLRSDYNARKLLPKMAKL